jgi:predicted nucleotidyltransferase
LRAATEFAQEIADSCAELLGDRLVAVILHGSLVLGDYSPAS